VDIYITDISSFCGSTAAEVGLVDWLIVLPHNDKEENSLARHWYITNESV
jgi:hypothetical protein